MAERRGHGSGWSRVPPPAPSLWGMRDGPSSHETTPRSAGTWVAARGFVRSPPTGDAAGTPARKPPGPQTVRPADRPARRPPSRLSSRPRISCPENTLRLYVHFSGQMTRGNIYRHVKLIRDDGREVKRPFLELDEELWSSDGLRATLFFDPGRVKRELVPREQDGPILEEGHSYALVFSREWKDAEGRLNHNKVEVLKHEQHNHQRWGSCFH